ncbi:hypothetical protein [Mycobacterium sp. E796]|uniref:hypothetical protein n=1 Tax=Mycobacterium sp. E796 TaxID=1834151 RepID=UPI000A8FDA9E|nr:hypothetical protein [Mycobacterium sp. E796]
MTSNTPVWAVYAFEIFCVAALVVIFGMIKQRYRDDSAARWHLYAVVVGSLFSFMWEWYEDIGPLELGYDHRFVSLWTIHGVSLPLVMPLAYGWYWAIPILVLLPLSGRLQHRFGRWQYLVIFIGGGLFNILVEYPATTYVQLWTYFWDQNSGWTLGGMPITNGPCAGTVTLFMYVGCRYLWDRRSGDMFRMRPDNSMHDQSADAEPDGSRGGTATLSVVRSRPVHLRERVVIVVAYAAVIALASELMWIIWTPLLGAAMDSWFTGAPGAWITSGH